MIKICSDCKLPKDEEEEFYLEAGIRYSRRCKNCSISRAIIWTINNPARAKLAHAKAYLKQRYARYGLTKGEYDNLVNSANNFCQICEFEMGTPVIDHDAKTGEVRGVLCTQCNVAIGLLLHDTAIIKAAADYLERFNARHKVI